MTAPRHTPSSIRAQELYARANQAAYEADHWETARDLYQACVEEDPQFVPAFAELARCHHLIAKFTQTPAVRAFARVQAEAMFTHALRLDASLALTQRLYAQFEVDDGRAADAAVRLLRAIERTGPDARVFAGLVHALRFCGLLEHSRRAHDRARELDPTIVTSVSHTCWLLGDYELALRETTGDIGYMPGLALASLGRQADAIAALRWRERDTRDNRARAFLVSLRALLEGQHDESLHAVHRATDELTEPAPTHCWPHPQPDVRPSGPCRFLSPRSPDEARDCVSQSDPVRPYDVNGRASRVAPRERSRVQSHEVRATASEIGSVRRKWRAYAHVMDGDDGGRAACRQRRNLQSLLVEFGPKDHRNLLQHVAKAMLQIEAGGQRAKTRVLRPISAQTMELTEARPDIFGDHGTTRRIVQPAFERWRHLPENAVVVECELRPAVRQPQRSELPADSFGHAAIKVRADERCDVVCGHRAPFHAVG